MTIHNVTTAAELTAALNAAVGGDRIELAPGNYGNATINQTYGSEVIIASQDQANRAVFNSIRSTGAANLTFEWLRFEDNSTAGSMNKPFWFMDGAGLTIRHCVFEGLVSGGFGTDKGLQVTGYIGLLVEFCEFFGWQKAAFTSSNTNVTMRNNDVHGCSNDGFNVNDSHNVLIEGNHFHDFVIPTTQGHNDMIQSWVPPSGGNSTNITIRGNFFDAGLGRSTQTIYMSNWAAGEQPNNLDLYHKGVVVIDNVIYNGHVHGITTGEVDGLTVRNNTILRDAHCQGSQNAPEIKPIGCVNTDIGKNIVHAPVGADDFGVIDADYPTLFVDATKPAPTLADLRAVAGGAIEAALAGAEMTRADIPLAVGPGAGSGSPPPPSNQAPVAGFTFSAVDLAASFVDTSTDADGSITTWAWDFGDGAFAGIQNPDHTYAAAGAYQVSLTVTDDQGATGTAVQQVTVSEVAPPPPPPPPGTGPVFQTGPHVFDGTLGAAQIFPHDAAYELADGTVEVAFTVDALVARQAIFSKDASGNANGGHFNLYLEQGKLIARLQDSSATYTAAKTAAIVAGQAYHVAVTFGAGGLTLWLDGVVVAADPYTGGLFPSIEPIVIGANNWASGSGTTNNLREPMTGTVDRAAIYDRVLSAEEIQSLATTGALPNCEDQLAACQAQVAALQAQVAALEAQIAEAQAALSA